MCQPIPPLWAQGEVPRRAVTGAELFQPYPTLHPFLLGELRAAALALAQGDPLLHPSLFPVLLLLSRLRRAPFHKLLKVPAQGWLH